jgi:hypothetical protein
MTKRETKEFEEAPNALLDGWVIPANDLRNQSFYGACKWSLFGLNANEDLSGKVCRPTGVLACTVYSRLLQINRSL